MQLPIHGPMQRLAQLPPQLPMILSNGSIIWYYHSADLETYPTLGQAEYGKLSSVNYHGADLETYPTLRQAEYGKLSAVNWCIHC